MLFYVLLVRNWHGFRVGVITMMQPCGCGFVRVDLGNPRREETMLVLTRKKSEMIRIGQDIVVKVIRTGRGSVKIGIQAPDHVRVLRGELIDESEESCESEEACEVGELPSYRAESAVYGVPCVGV